MTSEQFVYWLQGYLEVQNPHTIDNSKIQVIKDHIALVLTKVTPNRNPVTLPPTLPYDYPYKPDYNNPYIVTCTDDPHKTIC
jgi:hypothetical protein